MKRIASGSQVASIPTFPADSGTPGYFADAATTPTATPTEITPKWVTSVQEAICQTIEDSGAALSDTMSQFATVVGGVHGIKAHATDTGVVSTAKTRVIVGALNSRASAAESGVFGGSGNLASAIGAATFGGDSNAATAARTACTGGSSAIASAADATTLGGDNATASGAKSVAAGGLNLTASGENGAAVGGNTLTAAGLNAAAVGGATNTATGTHSFVGGGSSNSITSGGTYAGALGGQSQTLSGSRSATVGGNTNTTSGSDAVTVSGVNHVASGIRAVVVSGDANTVSATDSVSLASSASNVQSNGSFTNMALAASKNARLVSDGDPAGGGAAEDGFCLAGGYHASDPGAVTVNTNLTWMISSKNGMIQTSSTITASTDPNSDFAEMFENAEPGAIPDGTLLTRVGRKVRAAKPGDRVVGVVSATPGILLGTGALHYARRYAADDFGRPTYGLDGARVDAAGYDPTRPNVPRTARPDEWTAVALVGQVRVRIGPNVSEGDLLAPGPKGCAIAAGAGRAAGRPVEVMEITTPYDPAKGYGVALCLVG